MLIISEICSVFFNISKAFHSIPHAPLLQILSTINFDPHIIKWIQSYLSCQEQYVAVNETQSLNAFSSDATWSAHINTMHLPESYEAHWHALP